MFSHLVSVTTGLNALALAAAKSSKHSTSPSILIFIIFIVVIGYFLLVRPQRQRARRQQQTVSQIEVGDEVMLTSGIIGRVVHLEGDRGRVQIAHGVEIEVLRKAIAQRLSSGEGVEEDVPEAEEDVPPDPGAGEEHYDHLSNHHFDEGSLENGAGQPDDETGGPQAGDTGDADAAGGAKRRRIGLPQVPRVSGRAPRGPGSGGGGGGGQATEPEGRAGGSSPGVPSGGLTDAQPEDGRSGRD